jgi:hypothetical protein
MSMKRFQRAILCLFALTTPAAAQPPGIAIHEPQTVWPSDATYRFHVPDFPDAVTVRLTMRNSKAFAPLEAVQLTYGENTVFIPQNLLSDIRTPDPSTLSVTIVTTEAQKTEVVVYIADYSTDDSASCATRKAPSCGLIEFDWLIGGGIEKQDSRIR